MKAIYYNKKESLTKRLNKLKSFFNASWTTYSYSSRELSKEIEFYWSFTLDEEYVINDEHIIVFDNETEILRTFHMIIQNEISN